MAEPTSALEVERKYDVEADTALPDLRAWDVRAAERFALDATYYDTADLALRRAHLTLRRRTGGHDEGWHVKLPAGPATADRRELRLPLQDDVPDQLAAVVAEHAQGAPLQPVAHLATDRTVHVLCDPDGAPVAELADDRVVARRLGDGRELRWREWEVELLGDDRGVLDRVEAFLLAAGARPSTTGSKAGRVLLR